MKKQSGFTLIELMVVMAIIAILAIAGLAAYVGYIKQARDTARISDLATINKALLAEITNKGSSPTTIPLVNVAIKAVNNGTTLKDPLGEDEVCQPASGDSLVKCGYQYAQCDNGGGFVVATRFESKSNQEKYKKDGLEAIDGLGGITGLSNVDSYWSLGSCTTPCETGLGTCTVLNYTYIDPAL